LREFGNVPISQIGMNVKIWINNPKTSFLKERMNKKHINFRKGQEIIPDITIFTKNIKSDFRRRNYKNTLKETIYSLEIKASEREKGRLQLNEIKTDIIKLKSQFTETKLKHKKEIGIGMMVIDTAPKENERMRKKTLDEVIEFAKKK
jgi:type III secretory pathway component EscR